MGIYLSVAGQKDYDLWSSVDDSGGVTGYYCIGPTPMTSGTYDLYWIAVDPAYHSRGIGKELLAHAENNVQSHGGRLIVAETSSKPSYDNTREFYIRNRYLEAARIKDYYRTGDDLVIYGKYLSPIGRL